MLANTHDLNPAVSAAVIRYSSLPVILYAAQGKDTFVLISCRIVLSPALCRTSIDTGELIGAYVQGLVQRSYKKGCPAQDEAVLLKTQDCCEGGAIFCWSM